LSRTAVELPLSADRGRDVPLAGQIAGQLRSGIADGRLGAGERLPASRVLAASLGVSRTVVTAAYVQLYAEGWLDGRQGSGTFVAAGAPGKAGPPGQGGRPGQAGVPGKAGPLQPADNDLRAGLDLPAGRADNLRADPAAPAIELRPGMSVIPTIETRASTSSREAKAASKIPTTISGP